MTRNIGTVVCCDRTDCMVCLHPSSRGKCRSQGVTYQIACNRPPCVTNLQPRVKLSVPHYPVDIPPALYRGESSRSGYRRGGQHLDSYRDRDKSCPLWRHTRDHHGGQFGPERGLQDFFMTILRPWNKPLDRLTAEGDLIVDLEDMQHQGRAICINSKEDFQQSHSVTAKYTRGCNL